MVQSIDIGRPPLAVNLLVSEQKNGHAQCVAVFVGSPTWARTRDLRITTLARLDYLITLGVIR